MTSLDTTADNPTLATVELTPEADKGVILFVTLIVGLTADSRMRISFLEGNSQPQGEVLGFHAQLGLLIAIAVVTIWLAVAFGRTWAGFKRLSIGKEIEPDPAAHYYRLTVRNLGLFDVEVHTYAVAVADASGRLPCPQLPIELNWMHRRGVVSPRVSRGVPHKVDIFRVIDGTINEDRTAWTYTLAFTGLNDILIGIGMISSVDKNKLWIAISVENCEDERWFSIEAGDSPLQIKVAAGNPPFLDSASGDASKETFSFLDWLPDRLVDVAKGAIQGACKAAKKSAPKKGPHSGK